MIWSDFGPGRAPGCLVLPGHDPPEAVVFDELRDRQWHGISERTGRSYADVADALMVAMSTPNHHDWVRDAATQLVLSGDTL